MHGYLIKTYKAVHSLANVIFFLSCFILMLSSGLSFAFQQKEASARISANIEDRVHNSDTMVLRYTETLNLPSEPEGGVTLRLFKDGYIAVYYPNYMKRSGNYGLYLDPASMDQLWMMLTSQTVLAFDEGAIREHIQAKQQLQNNLLPTLSRVADAATTVIEIYPNNYGTINAFDGEKRIAWYGLKWDAKRYPKILEIQALALIQKRLQAILKRTDFTYIE